MVVCNGQPIKLILIKPNCLIEDKLVKYYGGDFTAIGTPSNGPDRKTFKADLKVMIPATTKCIICADVDMFKSLTKMKKTGNLDGVPVDTELGIPAFIMPNYNSIFYNPEEAQSRMDYINEHINDYLNGSYKVIGDNIIHSAEYPTNIMEVNTFLKKLYQYDKITVDIETASNHFIELPPKEEEQFGSGLHHFSNRLYSIGFAWDKHNGGAFIYDDSYKDLLKQFFLNYSGRLIFHNASFDITQLIYHLFMNDLEDYPNMLDGLHCMCDKTDDTYLMSYLALNSCSSPSLSLKSLAYEYSGNYAEDVSDVTKVPVHNLLVYNLKDVLSTWFVYEKYYPKMVEDEQETIYKDLFLPSLKTLIQTQLVGFRINVNALDKLTADLNKQYDDLINKLMQYPEIKQVEHILNQRELIKWNSDSKHKKVKTIKDFNKTFNPGSTNHVAILLYDILKIPVIELTEGGQPSCSSKTLKKLINRITDQRLLDILQLFIDISAVDQILVLFIPAFQRTPTMSDGTKGLFGSFNLGGTKTGRLSSSKPNLQNLPSTGSPYAKPVKDIFVAPKGFIFVGADQRSLEDRISALTTRDPNKIKVYTEGYDGHCLRSYSYFQEKMPDITEEINKGEKSEVEIINSIKARYPELRQKSKSITFCLTYSGTKYALMQECGLSEEDAIQAESRYHELYKVSDQWVKDHVNKACKEGYVTCAFGLKLRTPLIKKAIMGDKHTLKEARAEARTAGNALGQSWCLLNNRSANEVMQIVWNSPYKYDVLPVAEIHDALYFFVKDNLETLSWFNKILIKAMEWQEDPIIAHDKVKLGGDLEVFYPTWAHGIDIPNGASKDEIVEVLLNEKNNK